MLEISNVNGSSFATASNVYEVYKENNDKNIFELVLDNLILEKYSDDIELKDYIKSLPLKNKRIAILSLLGDDNVLWKQINELLSNDNEKFTLNRDITYLESDTFLSGIYKN